MKRIIRFAPLVSACLVLIACASEPQAAAGRDNRGLPLAGVPKGDPAKAGEGAEARAALERPAFQNGEYREAKGGFSIAVPDAWSAASGDYSPYQFIKGPEEAGFTANIAFVDEPYSGPVTAFVDSSLDSLIGERVLSDFELLRRDSFRTDQGIQGEYIIFQGRDPHTSQAIQQRLYFLPDQEGAVMMIIVCSSSPAGGEKYAGLFDGCVRTFKWAQESP
ncbi:MAG: hypothetical protein LBD37_11065 [Treponema sp.]|nr:hypothetical protein [Treponema sp.]